MQLIAIRCRWNSVVCLCVGNDYEPCKNGWTPIWGQTCGPTEWCIRWDAYWHHLMNTTDQSVWQRRCGLSLPLLQQLVTVGCWSSYASFESSVVCWWCTESCRSLWWNWGSSWVVCMTLPTLLLYWTCLLLLHTCALWTATVSCSCIINCSKISLVTE